EVFSQQRADWMHAAVLGPNAFALRFLGDGNNHRLVVANLGPDWHTISIAEPLLAAPAGYMWEMVWSSEAPQYGGCAQAPVDELNRWFISAHSTVILKSVPLRGEGPNT